MRFAYPQHCLMKLSSQWKLRKEKNEHAEYLTPFLKEGFDVGKVGLVVKDVTVMRMSSTYPPKTCI